MEPFKWGMVGSVARAQAFSSETKFTGKPQCLHAFLSSVDEVGDLQDVLPGVAIYNNISELLQCGIDAVYIASPHGQHYQQVVDSIQNGIPVLCERPVGESTEQINELVRLAEQHQTFLMEALWIRFMPVVRKVLSIMNNGLIGHVVSLNASVYYKSVPSVLPESIDIGGGALCELGIFPVFLSCLFFGRPSYINAMVKRFQNGEDEDFSAFLSYENGQYAFIEASVLDNMDSVITVCGDKGNIYIKNPWSAKPEGLEVDLADGTKMVHKSEWQGIGLYFEMDEVQACVQKGFIESPFYSHQFTIEVKSVMDRIKKQLIM